MTGNKQWKKGYSVRLEQKSQKSFKKICSANFLERFLRFLFKTYQLSLFPLFIPGHPLPPMAQAYGLSVAIPLFHASGLAIPLFHASGPGTPSFPQGCASRARNPMPIPPQGPKGPMWRLFPFQFRPKRALWGCGCGHVLNFAIT